MSKLEEARDILVEAREEYQERKHKTLTRQPNEDTKEWQRRSARHKKRIDNAHEVIRHLKKKVEALAEDKANRKDERKQGKNPYDKNDTKIVTFDGKQCVELAAYWLQEARNDGWAGVLVSGYRTPEYSEQLCYNMCRAPSCSGMCAGRSSNHAKTSYPGPAIDVSEYVDFEAKMTKLGSPLKNTLDYRDPVHFSQAGN